MSPVLSLGGRRYRSIATSTIEHDVAYQRLLLKSGLKQDAPLPGESYVEWGVRLLDRLVATGQLLPALGLLLIPDEIEDLAWTPEIGKETVAGLSAVADPAEKQVVHALIRDVLYGFFERAQAFSTGSTISSSQGLRVDPLSTSPGPDGPISSARSPGGIWTVFPRFCAGLWRKLSRRTAVSSSGWRSRTTAGGNWPGGSAPPTSSVDRGSAPPISRGS